MVAQVVVRDPGVLVDRLGGPVGVLGVDLGRDQHRGVAERAAVLEILTSLRRAGAETIVTYHAKDAARWLAE